MSVELAWTPAHSFLCTVRDKVDAEDAERFGKRPLEHEEFKEFWDLPNDFDYIE